MANHFLPVFLTYETPTLLGTIYQRHEMLSLGPSIINRNRCLLCHTKQGCASNPAYENLGQSRYAVSPIVNAAHISGDYKTAWKKQSFVVLG
jgi:hypothetical protein